MQVRLLCLPLEMVFKDKHMVFEDVNGTTYYVLDKKDLVDHAWYVGISRLGTVARWVAKKQMFLVPTYDCGQDVMDTLPHPEDAVAHYEVFRPLRMLDTRLVFKRW